MLTAFVPVLSESSALVTRTPLSADPTRLASQIKMRQWMATEHLVLICMRPPIGSQCNY